MGQVPPCNAEPTQRCGRQCAAGRGASEGHPTYICFCSVGSVSSFTGTNRFQYFSIRKLSSRTFSPDGRKQVMESMVEHHPEMVKPPSDPSPESPPKSLCLSAALESLPLVYLPETKQLVTAPWPRNPDLRTRAISSTSPAHARASCYDLPTSEFPFSDDCSCTKNLAGSKISEDSGYPGLWDSDASLSREAQSERNSSICSGEVLECDIEGDIEEEEDVSLHEGGERDEAFSSPVSSCGLADVPNPPSSSCFSANDSSEKEDGLTKDLQGLSVTTDSVATSEGTSLDSAAPGNTGESGAGRQTAERTRKGTFASFFTRLAFLFL